MNIVGCSFLFSHLKSNTWANSVRFPFKIYSELDCFSPATLLPISSKLIQIIISVQIIAIISLLVFLLLSLPSFRLSRVTLLKIRLCQSPIPKPPVASNLTQGGSQSLLSGPKHDGTHELSDSHPSLLPSSHADCLALSLMLKTPPLPQGLWNLCSVPFSALPPNI